MALVWIIDNILWTPVPGINCLNIYLFRQFIPRTQIIIFYLAEMRLYWKVGILDLPTPTPVSSRAFKSSKMPGRDFEDRCSLNKLEIFELPDTISSSTKNIPVLQDSMKSLGGQVESWQGYFWYPDTISSSVVNIPILQDSRRRFLVR